MTLKLAVKATQSYVGGWSKILNPIVSKVELFVKNYSLFVKKNRPFVKKSGSDLYIQYIRVHLLWENKNTHKYGKERIFR